MPTEESIAKGTGVLDKLFGWKIDPKTVTQPFNRITMGNLFGDVWTRPELAIEQRSMITVAALIVLGRESELRMHLRGALNVGITRVQIEEMILHLAHYGGWPVAATATRIAQEVFAEIDAGK
ncbi:MAG: carboxymuconolactone decarboxylase family protein [Deltaproteobacteria bacterium]|nr:carboxymuconolactone decarboxylase family protein [Deltaproteobacteria bacterium]